MAEHAWQAPQEEARLGSYRVLAELARGGMAAVFLALREPRQQPAPAELHDIARRARFDDDALRIAQVIEGSSDIAAIKQIHAHLAHDPDFVAMLMDEARIATKIHHPNVVEIREYRLGEGDGTNYIVMEYVAGESLSTLFKAMTSRGGRFSPALAASIGADVAGALHTAHELRGAGGEPLELVHRDVSPQNVIVRYDGRVKLTDFGVAKAVGRLQRTQPGEIKGKLAYMAPEQAYGRAVDRRSDVYSLGVVLYEVALGRRLFGGRSDAETVRNIIQHNVPAPRSVDPSFPSSLEEIIMGMLQADPAQRFQSAGAVERALRAFVTTAGEPEVAPRLGELARTLDPARYHAKTELVVRELAAPQRPRTPTPPPAQRPVEASPGESRTLLTSRPPARVATQAAPKARTPAPEPLDGATIPMTEQARAAIASIAPPAPERPSIGDGPPDYTQPTLRRAELDAAPDPTSPSFAPPVAPTVGERTLMAADPYSASSRPPPARPASPTPAPDMALQQTMLAELPREVMQQVAEAARSNPAPRPAFVPREEPSRKGLWAAVSVGVVLFALAALFALSRMR